LPIKNRKMPGWIPTFVGMTEGEAGMAIEGEGIIRA
jgi:hypothetical protein